MRYGNETPLSNQPMYIDSGFRPIVDGYNFENGTDEWGNYPLPPADTDFTMEDTRKMFGDLMVCIQPLENGCIYDPTLVFWNFAMNLGMRFGGHCAGMSASSLMYFEDPSQLHDLKDGADNLYEDISLADARRSIAYYHAVQEANPIIDHRINQEQVSTPIDTVNQILSGFNNGKKYVIAITEKTLFTTWAHAIVPIAISQNDSEVLYIFVYDNRSPGKVYGMTINKKDNTWKFSDRSGNADLHSFYAIPLEFFEGKQEFSYKTLININGSIDLLVSTIDKLRLGYFRGEFFDEIPGASIIAPSHRLGLLG